MTDMWEELLNTISDRYHPLESMQKNVAGYVDHDKGWDLTLINPWFNEWGYEFVGYLDLFSENEETGIYVAVEGLVWHCRTNFADNRLWRYYETGASKPISLDDMRSMRGWAHQFIWEQDSKECYPISIAE